MMGNTLQETVSDPAANSDGGSARQFVVIGGGPAGLTAAYELTKRGHLPIVIEKSHTVGGIARTESYKGYHFDMGGHRFFTKSKEVQDLWYEILGHDFLTRNRLSRIYYKKRFFNYPLKPANALKGLGMLEAIRILASYVRWTVFPYRQEDTFEQWVTNRFGKRLFDIFFKSYTEKVWGIPCSELRAEWAAQRIKDLSLKTAVFNMFFKSQKKVVKTLIDSFEYPRLGPGMLWRQAKTIIERSGAEVMMEAEVVAIHRQGMRITSVDVDVDGQVKRIAGSDFISSMPVTEFIQRLDPPAPEPIRAAANGLKYRDFLTVCLVVNKENLFPDNWIYIHEPDVQVGRIQNFGNWSPDMVPVKGTSSLGLEYFCNEGDSLWSLSDEELIALGRRELQQLGLVSAEDIADGCVFRVPKSYPVYDTDYANVLDSIKEFVNAFHNFQTIGRNGLHRYNNQDHAMMTGSLAVKNAVDGESHNLWNVNTDQEYHEEVKADQIEALEQIDPELMQTAVAATYAKLNRNAFGLSTGITAGMLLWIATMFLVIKGGSVVGPHLSLLSQYFPGYTVSFFGSFLGFFYMFFVGFVGGWVFAFIRNAVAFLYLAVMRRSIERQLIIDLVQRL
jgi:protoporphyrinogen oxidase